MTDDEPTLSRRSILRNGAATAGALAAGGAVTGSVSGGLSSGAETANKRGGRAQVEGDEAPDRNRPFTLQLSGTEPRGASCMSGESAEQTYLLYDIQYCDSDEDSDASMYVIPDEAELVESETYVIRSVQECKANENYKVAFGPARESC